MTQPVTFASWAVGSASRKEGDERHALVALVVNTETVYISAGDAHRIADSLKREADLVEKYHSEEK